MMKKGIDLSYCQTKVDWNVVDIDFVIVQAGYGRYASQKDTMFESHYKNAKAKKIPVGAYWYSYAMSEQEAVQEANACIQVLKGKTFEYPIYYDLEEQDQFNLGRAKVSAIAKAFLRTLENAGYYVGIYSNLNWLNNVINDEIKKNYQIWLAQWDVAKPSYKGCGIWQYAVTHCNGVVGRVDLDYAYKDYPDIIASAGKNGLKKAITSTSSSKTTKTKAASNKNMNQLVVEIFEGKWGNGTTRKKKLLNAGYSYTDVQKTVDKALAIAKEVIQGKWYNGAARKSALTKAGYDYTTIQKIVDIILK